MTTIVIEIYDIGVRVSDGAQILVDSASYALIESDQSIIIGEPAQQKARLRPREISAQFWGYLSSNSNTKLIVSNAELAYRHLKAICGNLPKNNYEALITTPNTLSKQDLGLLLGVSEKLAIPVVGIASNAVLAIQRPIPNCKNVFLDLLQDRIAITEIISDNKSVSVNQPNKVLSYGLQSLINNLAKTIANKFIAETRFDPMHLAVDEQQYFDKLPLWLNALESSNTVECSLFSDTNTYRVQLNKEYLLHANQKVFSEIANYLNVLFHGYETITIICSASCTQVFGLLGFLKTLPGCAVIAIDKITIAEHALLNKESIKTENKQIHYTTSVKLNNNTTIPNITFNSGSLSKLTDIPTHVLFNHQAFPLQTDLFVAKNKSRNCLLLQSIDNDDTVCKISSIGMLVEVKKLNSSIVKVNNEPLNTQIPVQVGDRLFIDDHKSLLTFIKVHSNETPFS